MMINNVIDSRPAEGLLAEDHCVSLSYNKRQTVVKYFYFTQVNLKSICTLECFSLGNFYFTTFQLIEV